uniref:protein-tyrosine-phosphatase n=1 Tax=Crassostrea virginica TaxID=6565 RepID=A0A8B8AQI0_CRAVI|nr:tyrosine-protein phosphatase 10D-like isoform X5 [Crassostrea virginica]
MEKPLYLLIFLIMLNRAGGSFNGTVNAISVSSTTGITETKNMVPSTVSSTDLETESQINSNAKDEPKEELTPMPTVSESLTPSRETLLSETRGPSLSEGSMTLEALAPSYKTLESLAPTVNKDSTTSLASSSATVEALAPTSSNSSTPLGAMPPTATTGSVISEAVASPTSTLETPEPLSSKESTISEGMSHISSKGSTQDLPSLLSDGSATSEAVAPSNGPTISEGLVSTPSRGFMISEALVSTPSKVPTISEGIVSTPSKGPMKMERLVSTPSKGPVISEGFVSTPSKVPIISEGLVSTLSKGPMMMEGLVSTPSKVPEISEGLVSTPSMVPTISEGLASTPSKGPMMMEGLLSTPSKVPVISEGLVSAPSKDLSEALNFTPSMGLAISESLVLTPSKKQKALAFTPSKDPLMSEGFVSTQGKGPMISEALISTPSKGLSEAFVSTTSKDLTISEALVSTPSSVPMISEARVTSLSNDAKISEATAPISSKDTTISQTLATAPNKDTMSFSEALEPLSSKESTISEELVVTQSKGLAISEAPVSGPTILERLVSTPRRGFTISKALPSKVPTISEGIVSTTSKGPMMSEGLVSSPSIDLSEELVSFPSKGLAISKALVSTPSKDLTVSEARVSTQNKGPTVSEELSSTSSKDTTVSDALVSSVMNSDALGTTTSKAYLTLETLAFTSSKVTSPSEALATTPSLNDNLSRIPSSTDLGKSTKEPVSTRIPEDLTPTTSESTRESEVLNPTTIPQEPECEAVHVKVLNRTESSMILYYNAPSGSSVDLCVKKHSEKTQKCFPIGRSNVSFNSLDAATNYKFSVFSYVNRSETEPQLSDSSCPLSDYTLPTSPNCTGEKPVIVYRNATSMTLIFNNITMNSITKNLCVKLQPSNDIMECTPLDPSTIVFGHLESGTPYNFSVFSYINTSDYEQLRSVSACSSVVSTLPTSPNCTGKGPVIVYRNASSLTLNFKNITMNNITRNLCVKLNPSNDTVECTPLYPSAITFGHLKSGTPYNFSVFSYINMSDHDKQLRSVTACSSMVSTLPTSPNCTGKGPVIVSRNATSLTLNFNNSTMNSITRNLCVKLNPSNDTVECTPLYPSAITFGHLKSGTPYNFSVFSYINTSDDKQLHSVSACSSMVSTSLRPPTCSEDALNIRSTEIIVDLRKCSFEIRTEFACVGCIKDNKTRQNISSDFTISDLAPGTMNNICISACGENLVESDTLKLTKYTRPSNPWCDLILTESTNTSVKIVLEELTTNGSVNYILKLGKINKMSDSSVVFDNLFPNTEYSISVTAIGHGNMTSLSSCNITVYTRPTDPICRNVLIFNHTTKSLVMSMINMETTGAISYIAKYNTSDSEAKNVTFEEEKQYQRNITYLKPGTLYTFDIFSVGNNSLESVEFCKVVNFTRPATPINISLVERNSTTLRITWKPGDGGAEKYVVTVNCSCCKPFDQTEKSKTTVITDLDPGCHCNISITAVAGQLHSLPLIYYNMKTEEKASQKVTNVNVTNVNSYGFKVLWTEPVITNGDLLFYRVNISNSSFFDSKHVNVPSPMFLFENLTPGTCYMVSIAAVNEAGDGEIEKLNVYTVETAPSMVTNLITFNTSSTSIAVTWSKPLNPNGVITKYEITVYKFPYSEEEKCIRRIVIPCMDCQRHCPNSMVQQSTSDTENKVPDENMCTVETLDYIENNDTFKYNVSGLDIFTAYEIHVKAFTASGSGLDASQRVNTSEDKPTPPGMPHSIDVKSQNMSFNYTKPENENGIITHLEIEFTHLPYNVCAADTDTAMTVVEKETLPVDRSAKQWEFSLKKLKPFWEYSIRVRVNTSAGFSNFSEYLNISTLPSTPGRVADITFLTKTSRSLMLSWTQPCHPNGIIINYRINIQNYNDSIDNQGRYTNNNNTLNTTNKSTSFNVTNLLPYRFYIFTVNTEVQDVGNLSEPTVSEPFQTDTEAPYPPGNITFSSITSSSVQVWWEHPNIQTGPTSYKVVATDKNDSSITKSCSTTGFTNTSCNITGLDAYWDYTIAVRVKVDGFTPNNSSTNLKTKQDAPGRVALFIVTQDPNITAKTNVIIQWKPPIERDLNGIIQKYFILYWYQRDQTEVMSYDSKLKEAKIEVEAEKVYTFQIFSMTIKNATEDDFYKQSIRIKPGAPFPPPKQNITIIMKSSPPSDDQTQINVAFSHLAICDDSNGRITKWYIIVSKGSGQKAFRGSKDKYESFIKKNYKTWKDVYDTDNNVPYIASDSWTPNCTKGGRRRRSVQKHFTFTLGVEGECVSGKKYCNGNLEPGESYSVRYSVCTDGGCLESEFSEPFKTASNLTPVVAGTTTAVILLVFVIIIVIIVIKRRGMGPFKKEHGDDAGHPNEAFSGVEMKVNTPKAVKIAEFANYVQKMHADSNLLFSSEYKTLKETCPTHPTKAAEVQVNRIKNRYTNILAYDHSRVKLLPTEDDEGSDYINANYIQGFNSQREYIATQGPLPFTRDDFWRMIWEQNVSIIVMLTQLVERGRRKCDMYWPEASREPVYYGDLIVELESESTLPDYVLRVMSVKLGDTRKIVKQFSFLAWPDMGIPETSETMLKFAKDVRGHAPLPVSDRGPIVIHCSAGVGRTGTFIAVDYLMQFVRTSDVIDIYSYVMKMRNNRPNMVQTEDQYVFIHDCLRDFVNQNSEDDDEEEETPEDQIQKADNREQLTDL